MVDYLTLSTAIVIKSELYRIKLGYYSVRCFGDTYIWAAFKRFGAVVKYLLNIVNILFFLCTYFSSAPEEFRSFDLILIVG